jgi:DNA-binding beta-propeller fold protein YncE
MHDNFKEATTMKTTVHYISIALAWFASMLIFSTAQAQNLFESDGGSGNIYEFTPNGTRSTFASGLSVPAGLAFDSAGNLFVADDGDFSSTGGMIYKFTTNAVRSTFASGLNAPVALAFDKSGNLFEADYGSGKIYKFATNAIQSTFASGLKGPLGLAFDSGGNLFSTDAGVTNTIYKFTTNGVRSLFFSDLPSVYGLAFDSDGHLLETEGGGGQVAEFTTDGSQLEYSFPFAFGETVGLAFDNIGNLFVTDPFSGKIYEFHGVGLVPIVFASGLSGPSFIAFQPIPQPALNIAPAGNQVALYWPALATHYSLQSVTNMSSTNWVTVTNGTPIIGVTLTNTQPAAIFRLQSQ